MKNKLALMMAAMVIAGWLQVGLGQTYQIIEGSFTWHEAKADAAAKGGHLAILDHETKQSQLETLVKDEKIKAGKAFYIGATDEDIEGVWKWVNGSALEYDNWGKGEPTGSNAGEDYATFTTGGWGLIKFGDWNDVDVGARLGYILETPKVDLESGLVAYYPFNGNADDESGNGYDGEVTGATLSEDRFGNSNRAYYFNGNQITTPNFSEQKNGAVSLWLNANSWGGNRGVLSSRIGNSKGDIVIYDGGMRDYIYVNIMSVSSGQWHRDVSTTFVEMGNWYHLVCTWDQEVGTKLFVNSKKESSNAAPTTVFNGNPITIGRDSRQGGLYFDGKVDDVRIYNRALSEDEVEALYELESMPSSTYQIVEGDFTWHEAKADAEARGGHLATITSGYEQELVNEISNDIGHVWIGGTYASTEGSWEWVTGENWGFENWNTGDPNVGGGSQYFLTLLGGNTGQPVGKWNDVSGGGKSYILETPKVDLESGLVAYYPFNGNANDESGNGNNGTITGATLVEDRFGNSDAAYRIDDKGDVIDTPDFNSNEITVSLWYDHHETLGNWNTLLGHDGGGYHHLLINPENEEIGFYNYNIWNGSGYKIIANTTYFITLIKSGSNSKIYIDGLLVFSHNNSFENNVYPLSRIGNHGVETQGALGIIDDVRIYDRALSEVEVAALYELERTPSVGPVDPGEPQLATGSATVVNGFMVDLTVDFGGKGYTNPPEVRIVGGGGSGATAKAVVIDGIVIDLIVLTPGIGYSSTPSVDIDMPPFPPKQASATVQVVNGFVVGFEVTDSGRGYIEPPQISILSNTGSGVQAEAILSEGKLTEITVLNPGIGYSDDATVEVGPPAYPPVRAAGQAEVINGFLVGLEVTDGGRGYGFAPRVKITGGGGSGATAVALVEDGKVVGLNITSAGSGYSSAPEIIIAPPKPEVRIVRGEEGVKVKGSSNPGLRCRLEGSRDLITWSKVGNDVVSKSYEVNFMLDATETKHFFRVIWLD